MAMAARLSLVAKRDLGPDLQLLEHPGVICLLSRQKLDKGLLPQPLHGEAVRLHQRVGRGRMAISWSSFSGTHSCRPGRWLMRQKSARR